MISLEFIVLRRQARMTCLRVPSMVSVRLC